MSKFTSDERARGICDRCGFSLRLKELSYLTIRTKRTALRVCRRCWDEDHPQLKQGMYPVADVQAVRAPRPDFAGYPSSRATIVPLLSGAAATGYVGSIFFPNEVSVTVGALGVQGAALVAASVSVYTTYGLTSAPYPVSYIEAVDAAAISTGGTIFGITQESVDVAATFTSGSLVNVLSSYTNWPAESVDTSATFTSGNLQVVLRSYTNWPAESVDVASTFTSGTLTEILITYSNYPQESIDVTAAFTSGVLT